MAVIFSEAFTVASDIAVQAHPSVSERFRQSFGNTANFYINAANDRCQGNLGLHQIVRIVAAGVPPGMVDQEVRFDGYCSASGGTTDSAIAMLRGTTSRGDGTSVDLGNFYTAYYASSASQLQILRWTNGGSTVVAFSTQGGIAAGSHTFRFKATGTNPVQLEFQIDSYTPLTYSDSASDRKMSGAPGFGLYISNADVAWVDNVVVDDLDSTDSLPGYFWSATNPADNTALAGPGPITVTPPSFMQTGDLVLVTGFYKNTGITYSIANAGGQIWNSLAEFSTTALEGQVFWCRFNGTWSANPTFQINTGTLALSFVMHVFRPAKGDSTWEIDVAQVETDFAAPSSPFTVTVTGQTTLSPKTVTLAAVFTSDDNSWGVPTAGWTRAGDPQYRNIQGNDTSAAFFFKVQAAAGATGNVAANQTVVTGDAGTSIIFTFKEVTSGPPPITKVGLGDMEALVGSGFKEMAYAKSGLGRCQ